MGAMSIPTLLTVSRMALAPLFFVFYQLAGAGSPWSVAACWLVFILIETSDLLDGHLARRLGQVSEIGKVLDPLADAISRLTYFTSFTGSGIMPLWILLVLVYRDVGVAYVRVLVASSNVLQPARLSGKVKAWVYAAAGMAGLLVFSARALDMLAGIRQALATTAKGVFLAAAAAAVFSLLDYGLALPKNRGAGR